jgi:hypothetical protein
MPCLHYLLIYYLIIFTNVLVINCHYYLKCFIVIISIINILCCINRSTLLCKIFFNLLEFLAEAFRCHVHNFQCLTVPVELAAMFRFRKASAKNSSKLNKFLHSEVNILIQHIIVQDQDGQNNNINILFSSSI